MDAQCDKLATELKPRPHQQHVERCFDMSNVAVRHVAVFGNTLNNFFSPFDVSKQIEHVQFLSTCRTNEQQVAVEEAGVRLCRHVERSSIFIPCLFVSVVILFTAVMT